MSKYIVFIALVVFIGFTASAEAMRCGTKLVLEGDRKSKVKKLCGEPDDISASTIIRAQKVNYRLQRYLNNANAQKEILITIPVEEWTYELGPQRLTRVIRFENSIIVDIEVLGH